MDIEELELKRVPKAELLPPEEFERERQKRRAEYVRIVVYGQSIKVIDEGTLEQATQVGRLLQTVTKELTDFYKPVKDALNAAKTVILDKEKADMGEVRTVKDNLALQVLKYQTEKERLHQEADRQARLKAAQDEENRRIAEAIELESMGLREEAALRLDEPALPPPAIVSAGPKRIAGSVTRTTWHAQVDDLMQLIRAVASGRISVMALQVNQHWLDGEAANYKEGLQIPGVSAHKSVSGHFRS